MDRINDENPAHLDGQGGSGDAGAGTSRRPPVCEPGIAHRQPLDRVEGDR
jgi:hypothetical protein